jgi:hypothetical protein
MVKHTVKGRHFSAMKNGSKVNGTWIARFKARRSSSSPLETWKNAELYMMTIRPLNVSNTKLSRGNMTYDVISI